MNKLAIIIAHSGLKRRITRQECEAVLPDHITPVDFVEFAFSSNRLEELSGIPFEQLAFEQTRHYKTNVQPLLDKYPDAVVAYFGLAPIPLAVHLGFLFGNYSEFLFFQFHHSASRNPRWYLKTEPPKKDFEFKLEDLELLEKVEKGKGDIFIRIGISYRIEQHHTLKVLSDPSNEFDLKLRKSNPDAISNQDEMECVLTAFNEIIQCIADYMPGRQKIHLFASVSTGLAFALGTRINPTIFSSLQTYQFDENRDPEYEKALLISSKSHLQIALNEEDIREANKVRKQWAEELQTSINSFIESNTGHSKNWLETLQLIEEGDSGIPHSWMLLPMLNQTSLLTDILDLEANEVSDGFKYDRASSKWSIDDSMLLTVKRRLEGKELSLDTASRLFFIHEALHYSKLGHNISGSLVRGIGKFPKVIEEADYQADVYAMLHEYRIALSKKAKEVKGDIKGFFLSLIDIATETAWSFIDNGFGLDNIQVRSMNRFLNWYWQWVKIESLPGSASLRDIIEILFEKPVIEFSGPSTFVLENKYLIKLDNSSNGNQVEMAAFIQNRIVRTTPTDIESVIDGFRTLDGTKIKDGLRNFLHTVNPN